MKTAVILFNLGGPDGPDAVRPFLFNLFNDPAIIRLPTPLRWLVAKLISTRRAPIAREIYNNIGGRSPILPNTESQARALEAALGPSFKTFIAMRYWHPRAVDCVVQVKAWQPDRIILLPLYPQYSTTTTASSAKEWDEAARRAGLQVPTSLICCYPRESGFAEAVAARVRAGLAQLPAGLGSPRILFSAHGLPESIVLAGDPYQYQVTESVAAVRDALNLPDLDCQICYQSRVGPVKWLGPATDDEIRRAGRDQVPVVVVPIAFVSEHSETLVELDIEYRHLADEAKVPAYIRVPTVDALPSFIEGLARMIRSTATGAAPICSSVPDRLCPAGFAQCAFQTAAS